MPIAKLDGGITEGHGETRRQHLHLQLRGGQLHDGKRVGAHDSLHHLTNGGDFGFLQRIPGNRRAVWTGHPLTTHICAVQSVQKRGTHRTRFAQELHNIFARLKRICHLVRTCLTHCCSLTCRLPRANHLPHLLFLLPRHQNTHFIGDNTIYSKKTWRVAETLARQLLQKQGGH